MDSDGDPESLDELLELMAAASPYCDDSHGDWRTDLPVFGGECPDDTRYVWSWDEGRLLVGTCPHDVQIVPRVDPEDWPWKA